jgi:hypothetical protein
MVTEIDQQADPQAGCLEIIMDLGAVFISQPGHRFDLDDDLFETNKVRLITLPEGSAFVFRLEYGLSFERDSPLHQFQLKAFLKDCFEKSAALLFVHFKARTQQGMRFIGMNQLRHGPTPFRVFSVFRGLLAR